jgi:hypothetical protein
MVPFSAAKRGMLECWNAGIQDFSLDFGGENRWNAQVGKVIKNNPRTKG